MSELMDSIFTHEDIIIETVLSKNIINKGNNSLPIASSKQTEHNTSKKSR